MKEKRARFRFLASATATCATFGIVQSVRAAQFEYKLATPTAPENPSTGRSIEACNAIRAETNGRMQITVFPNSELGSETALVSQLRLGAIQFMPTALIAFSTVASVASTPLLPFVFKSTGQALRVLDGPLGAYIRKEMSAKGLYVFERTSDAGFRQITSSTKPIRTADDLVGFKIRTPPTSIFVDFFRSLGAIPISIDSVQTYAALQTHIADGEEGSYDSTQAWRYYEVQKYLSITNHMWNAFWMAANPAAWNALPSDIQAVITRNVTKYSMLEREDIRSRSAAIADKLRRQGLIFNTADTTGMRSALGPYYAHWKSELGSTAWNMLEAEVGKVG